jgi:N,N'-diacetylchitobiose phosphorylase
MGRDHTAHGRARHPWLTGTAGWMYTAATKYMLGVRISFDGLVIDPCIPAEWEGFDVVRQWREATYNIKVQNPSHIEKGVASVSLNGKPLTGSVIPQQPSGSVNTVNITMG